MGENIILNPTDNPAKIMMTFFRDGDVQNLKYDVQARRIL